MVVDFVGKLFVNFYVEGLKVIVVFLNFILIICGVNKLDLFIEYGGGKDSYSNLGFLGVNMK